MKLKLTLCLLFWWTVIYNLHSQVPQKGSLNRTGMDFGFGAGLDYGGLGGRLTAMPHKNFGLFFSGGFAIVDFGYNAGANIAFKSERKTIPYLTAMYGYNAAIKVSGADPFEKMYYGPSFGIGWKRHLAGGNNFFNIEILIPIRAPDFREEISRLKSSGAKVNFVPPFAVSLGIHFGSTKKE